MNPQDKTELLGRLALVEHMIAEGRRSTARRGWLFLLWGLGPLTAIAWQTQWPPAVWAWPVTMTLCVVINGLGAKLRSGPGRPETTALRSVGAVWICSGATLVLLAFGAAWSGVLEARALYVIFFALAAVAHGSSSLILRWLPQFLAALVWWLASILAFILPLARLPLAAMSALVLGNIVFGAWLLYRERSLEND